MTEFLPEIDANKCTLCGACVTACPAGAVGLGERAAQIMGPKACTYCASCEETCPEGAIALRVEFVFKNVE